ncbi:unnamed protein product [Peniophora sp. CBMAI 1063]|nr:unnamed protein product [Peniophora sp. CBMAI 1063]
MQSRGGHLSSLRREITEAQVEWENVDLGHQHCSGSRASGRSTSSRGSRGSARAAGELDDERDGSDASAFEIVARPESYIPPGTRISRRINSECQLLFLPPEMLMMIFKRLCLITDPRGTFVTTIHVSRYWRAVILKPLDVWRSMHGMPPPRAQIEDILERAHHSDLDSTAGELSESNAVTLERVRISRSFKTLVYGNAWLAALSGPSEPWNNLRELKFACRMDKEDARGKPAIFTLSAAMFPKLRHLAWSGRPLYLPSSLSSAAIFCYTFKDLCDFVAKLPEQLQVLHADCRLEDRGRGEHAFLASGAATSLSERYS